MKSCNKCLRKLSKEHFYKNKRRKDGLNSICKECVYESRPKVNLICSLCNRQFKRVKSDYNPSSRIFCGENCRIEWLKTELSRKRVERKVFECDYCGKSFERLESQVNGKLYIFCSRDCQYKGNSKFFSGERSPNWNHEKPLEERIVDRKYEEYYEWRKRVYERDSYTCVKCGDDKGGNLQAHHIYNYSEHIDLRTDIDNGVTLCKNCHTEFHLMYGFTRNNRRQFDEFMTKECVS